MAQDVATWARQCVVLSFMPLSTQQQTEAISKQIGEKEHYFGHLFAFTRIRAEHDQLYEREFSAQHRQQIESVRAPDGFILPDGRYDPTMRQMSRSGSVVAPLGEGFAPSSAFVTALTAALSADLLAWADTHLLGDNTSSGWDGTAEGALQLLASHVGERLDIAQQKTLCKLALLVRKRRSGGGGGGGDPHATASKLWPTIVARTDEIYQTVELVRPAFEAATAEVCRRVGGVELLAGGLKDPVRETARDPPHSCALFSL